MHDAELVAIWVAAVMWTGTALVYLCAAPWWRSGFGRAFGTTKLSLALLLDLSLLFYYFPRVASERVALAVYVLIALGGVLMLPTVVRAQVRRHRP